MHPLSSNPLWAWRYFWLMWKQGNIACQNRTLIFRRINCGFDTQMITLRKIHSRRCTMKVSQGSHCWLEYHKLHSKKTQLKPTSRSFPNWPPNLANGISTPSHQRKSYLSSPKSIRTPNRQPKGPGTLNSPLSSISSIKISITISEALVTPPSWKSSIDPLDLSDGPSSKRKLWMKSSFARSNPETAWCLSWWLGVEWGSVKSSN